jgi:hypothetical protein
VRRNLANARRELREHREAMETIIGGLDFRDQYPWFKREGDLWERVWQFEQDEKTLVEEQLTRAWETTPDVMRVVKVGAD